MPFSEKLRKVADVGNEGVICVNNYNFVLQVKDKRGRVKDTYYYNNLRDCVTDLESIFVLTGFPEIKELKEFSDKFVLFHDELKKVCDRIGKEWDKNPIEDVKKGDETKP